MLPIAGQTAGPIGMKFFCEQGVARGCYRLKKIRFFFSRFVSKFFSTGPSASITYFTHFIGLYT